MIPASALVVALLASTNAQAQDEQYREFKLSDGRDFTAIIEATEAAGFKVRVPQGTMSVSFDQLFDMVPVTKAEYDSQPDWLVYLAAPPERQKGLADAFEDIPHVAVYGSDKAPSGTRISLAQEQQAGACDVDITCIATALAGAPWVWIVVANQEGSDLVFTSQTNTGTPRQNPVRAGMINPDQINEAPWTVLELTPATGSTSVVTPLNTHPTKDDERTKAAKLVWVPIPGMPSLARKDMGGFGMSLATAVPATALWIGAVGQNAQSGAGTALLGLGGYYAITVAVNEAIGLRALPKSTAIGIGKTPGGGAQVMITVPR